MIKSFPLVLIVTLVVGCTAKLKTKSEWFDRASCNVEVEYSEGAILCTRVEPKYPRKAALKGQSGRVTVSFDVDPQGKARNLEIEKSNPKRIFDKAAKEAIRQWKFIPKFENNTPIEDIGLSFTLTFSQGQEANISKEDWLKNLHAILQAKRCDKLNNQESSSCREKINEIFYRCVNNESALDSISLIDNLNFATTLGNKITSCVIQKKDGSGE